MGDSEIVTALRHSNTIRMSNGFYPPAALGLLEESQGLVKTAKEEKRLWWSLLQS